MIEDVKKIDVIDETMVMAEIDEAEKAAKAEEVKNIDEIRAQKNQDWCIILIISMITCFTFKIFCDSWVTMVWCFFTLFAYCRALHYAPADYNTTPRPKFGAGNAYNGYYSDRCSCGHDYHHGHDCTCGHSGR